MNAIKSQPIFSTSTKSVEPAVCAESTKYGTPLPRSSLPAPSTGSIAPVLYSAWLSATRRVPGTASRSRSAISKNPSPSMGRLWIWPALIHGYRLAWCSCSMPRTIMREPAPSPEATALTPSVTLCVITSSSGLQFIIEDILERTDPKRFSIISEAFSESGPAQLYSSRNSETARMLECGMGEVEALLR